MQNGSEYIKTPVIVVWLFSTDVTYVHDKLVMMLFCRMIQVLMGSLLLLLKLEYFVKLIPLDQENLLVLVIISIMTSVSYLYFLRDIMYLSNIFWFSYQR